MHTPEEPIYYHCIEGHKTEFAAAVVDEDGTLQVERRVEDSDLEQVTGEYAGNSVTLAATSNCYVFYDTLSEKLEVSVMNPLKTIWIAEAKFKNDRVNAKKLIQPLRIDMVTESNIRPKPIRFRRRLIEN